VIKTLKRLGNTRALVIDKTLMESMGIDEDTPLQLTLSGNTLIVTPANVGLGRERVEALMGEVRAEFGDALKNLAK
jgi:antitoxin component of MazEF toxin-antitoxin module